MFLKYYNPEALDSLKSAVSSMFFESVMLSWSRHLDFLHFFKNHMPASNSLLELYM